MEISTILTSIGTYSLAPIGAFIMWALQKRYAALEKLFERMTAMEQDRAVTNVILQHLEDDVKDIKLNLNKLVKRGYDKVQ